MIEILEPLKVGDCDAPRVDIHVGDDEAAVLLQDLVRRGGDWTVGSFSDDLGLDLGGVTLVDGLLHGGGDEDVALLVHETLPGVGLGPGEAHDSAMFKLVVLQSLGVDPLRIVDGSVPLGDAHTGGPSSGEVPAGVQADVAEALHDVRLAAPAWEVADHGHVITFIDEVVQAVEDSPACGGGPAVDAALVDGLPSDAGAGVHVGVADGVGEGVGNPGHLPLPSAHVGRGHVNARSKESLLGQLDGEPPGDPLQLVLAVLLGVDLNSGLAASEGNIHTCALVGHQGRESLHLVSTDVQGVADTSLAGGPVTTC